MSLKYWMGKLAVLEISLNQVFRGKSFGVVEVESSKELEYNVPGQATHNSIKTFLWNAHGT